MAEFCDCRRLALALARELLALSDAGLRALVAAGREPAHVTIFLDPLRDVLATETTFAERCLARWNGDLHRSPARFVEAFRIA